MPQTQAECLKLCTAQIRFRTLPGYLRQGKMRQKTTTTMLKPKLINIVFYFFSKYILFCVFMMFRNNDFTFIQIKALRNGEDWFFYLWMFLFLPVLCSFLFAVPVYYIFKVESIVYFILLIGLIFTAEYFLYTYFASPSDLMNGVYNGIIGLLLLLIFFYKAISLMVNKRI